MNRGVRPSSIFRTCTIVSSVLAFGLTACAILSVWKYTSHDTNDWNATHKILKPAYEYYDLNRNANAILAIRSDTVNVASLKDTCSMTVKATEFANG